MKQDSSKSLRYGMFIPLALMFASLVTICFSYSGAKQNIAADLNDAIVALTNEYREQWTRQDTIAALRHMHETTHKPLIYQASDVSFRNAMLKDEAYFTLALVDMRNAAPKIHGTKIASDSIMLVPDGAYDGLAIKVQGFADCSMGLVFPASDKTLPGILLTLSILSAATLLLWRRKEGRGLTQPDRVSAAAYVNSLEGIKLTPMQRTLTQMLLDSPGNKVDKATICTALWGNKSNAEESLYTLVRRTKSALSAFGIEIVCNRGESYELRINN